MSVVTRIGWSMALGVLLLASVVRVAGGQGYQKPALPEGPIVVRGEVAVTNTPTVNAQQSGSWSVRLEGGSRVQMSTPSFVEKNGIYQFRWAETGQVEMYRVVDAAPDGWVLADRIDGGTPNGRQYLNVARAISIAREQSR